MEKDTNGCGRIVAARDGKQSATGLQWIKMQDFLCYTKPHKPTKDKLNDTEQAEWAN